MADLDFAAALAGGAEAAAGAHAGDEDESLFGVEGQSRTPRQRKLLSKLMVCARRTKAAQTRATVAENALKEVAPHIKKIIINNIK